MFSVCEKLLLICIPRIGDKKQFQIALHANAIITYIYPSRKRPTYNSRVFNCFHENFIYFNLGDGLLLL